MRKTGMRLLAVLLAVVMVLPSLLIPGMAAEATGFKDVPQGSWYEDAVNYVSEKGYMTGVAEDKFAPNDEVTRAMFVTILARITMAETDGTASAFTDVPANKWYTGAVSWAAENGIVNGVGDGMFAPGKSITRQDLCTILYRFVNAMDYELTVGEEKTFTDGASVSSYAAEAVRYASSVGLIAGYDDGTFRPRATATRAQMAVIIMRLARLLDGQIVKPEPMPAQYFEEYPAEDMKVAASAPQGALPENSSMNVTRVTDEARLAAMEAQFGRKVLFAADISFRKDATELEPNKEVNVSITCDLLNDLTEFSLVHIADDGSYEYVGNASLMTMYRGSHSKMLRFSAKDFSVYAVLEGQTAVQVNFFNEGATEPHNMQKVIKNGNEVGKVFDPGVDLPDAKVFVGWTIYKNGEPQKVEGKDYYDIAAVNAYLAANFDSLNSIDVKAVLHDVRYLAYVDETDRVLRTVSLTYSGSNPKHTVDQDYFPANSKAQFYGWTRTKTSLMVDYPIGSEITVTADMVDDTYTCRLYPVCKRGNWLVFDNNIDKTVDPTSATFTSPQIVLTGESTVEPAEPTRTGYTFGGWYTTPACTQEFTFGNPLPDTDCDEHGEKKLYAKWTPDKASYLVVYMTQDPNDASKYNYHSSERRNYYINSNGRPAYSFTGYTVNAITGTNKRYKCDENGNIIVNSQGNVTAETYNDAQMGDYSTSYTTQIGDKLGYFYTFNATKTANQTVTVKGDGSAVLYVYYDRKTVTYNFYEPVYTVASQSFVFNNIDEDFYDLVNGVYYPLTYAHSSNSNYYYWWHSYGEYDYALNYSSSSNYQWYYKNINGSNEWTAFNYGYKPNTSTASDMWKFKYISDYSQDTSKTISGIYMADIAEGDWPTPLDNMQWAFQYTSGSSTRYIYEPSSEGPGYYYVPAQIGNSVTVNYYLFHLPVANEKATLHSYTQDPETDNLPYTVNFSNQEFSDVMGISLTDLPGRKLKGVNYRTNSTTSYYQSVTPPYDVTLSNITNPDGNDCYAYFDLLSYELAYESQNDVTRRENVLYTKRLTDYEYTFVNGSPTEEKYVPSNGGAGYFFDGWYTNNTFLFPFDFSSRKMPTSSVKIVAKWTQERFRVVLDPTGGDTNVHAGKPGTMNPNEVYFPGNQATTFKIWYGESVLGSAIENVQRPGYELVGWYVDTVPNNGTVFDTPFNFNTPIKDDVVDLSYKNAPADKRQGDDPWDIDSNTNLPKTYNDADGENDNVIGKLVIYAKWRKVLKGDTYVRVVYDCADGTLQGEADWTDPLHYADQAQAVAAPAAQANEAGYMFAKWTVMKNENGQLVETDIDKLPGDTFDVLVENAGDPETIDGHNVYTVYLKASYSTISNTHITWYGNGGVNAEGKDIENSPDAIINSFTNIKPADTFTRDGYVFLGWARLNEDDCGLEKDEAHNIIAATRNDNLGANDLWLIYDEENDSFKVNSEVDSTAPGYPTVSMVAPDEKQPYHIMYAVWAPCCYVYHSATGLLEAVPLTSDNLVEGKLDLTQRVTPGYLYGGYYTTMGGLEQDAVNAAKKVAGSSENYVAHVLHAPLYDGSNLYTDSARTTKFWTGAKAVKNVKGTDTAPQGGEVYYLKEVPSKYLTSRIQYVYEGKRPDHLNEIIDMYLVTIIDDNLYQSAGFKVDGSDNVNTTAFTDFTTLGNSFTIAPRYDGYYTTIDAPFFGLTRGYVGTLHKVGFACKNSVFTMVPTWTTLDGVTVSNNGLTIQIGASGKRDSISWKRNYDGTEKLYVNIKNAKDSSNSDMNWLADGAVPMVYVNGEVKQWVELKKTSVSGIYQITVPAGKETGMIICRNSRTGYSSENDAKQDNNNDDGWYPTYGEPSQYHIIYDRTPDILVPSSAENTPNYDCTVNYISAFGIGDNASCTWADYLSDQTKP